MKKSIIYYAFAAMSILSVSAQNSTVEKTITMPVEFQPSLLSISRMNSYPNLLSPNIDIVTLSMSDFSSAATPVSTPTLMDAPDAPDIISISPYRGYAALGYMPVFNLGASAGYRFINKENTTLGAWLQYDGNSYKSNTPMLPDSRLTRNTFTLNADFAHNFRGAGRLGIEAGMTIDGLNRPWLHNDSTLSTSQFRLGANWSARRTELAYFAGFKFNSFSYNSPDYNLPVHPLVDHTPQIYDSPTEARYTAHGGAAYFLSDKSSVTGHVDIDFLHYTHFQTFGQLADAYMSGRTLAPANGKTLGVITFEPGYRFRSDLFNAKLGVKLQFTHKSGKTIHLAPDVNFAVTPHSMFKAYINLGGGEHINNYASLYNYTPYTSSSVAYNNSHIPFTGELGLNFGPVRGLSVDLKAGYAVANDWLMPVALTEPAIDYFFRPVNLNAWFASADISWRVNDMVSFSLYGALYPGSMRHSYYLNRDRAKGVYDIKVAVKPIDKLLVDLSFSGRTGRSAMTCVFDHHVPGAAVYSLTSLKSSSSLNIAGRYELFEWLSVFARFENILNNRAGNLPYLEGQGFKGLFGAEIKF